APEEDEQHDGRGEVGGDQERQEVLVVLVDVPAEETREDDAVPETRDREELGHSLEESEHARLEVRDLRREDQVSDGCSRFLPVWNQAKTRSATPRRNDAIPCFTWWCPDPASWPGMNDGSEPAGSTQ